MDENAQEDDQQIASAAEAMVQLSGGYGQQYIKEEESMDVDPNYDPSDFLGNLNNREPREQKPQLDINIAQYEQMNTYQGETEDLPDEVKPAAIHDDLAISDSDDEDAGGAGIEDGTSMKQELSSFDDDQQSMANQSGEQQQQQLKDEPNTSTEVKENNDDDADSGLLWF